jgi:hypothetical protein
MEYPSHQGGQSGEKQVGDQSTEFYQRSYDHWHLNQALHYPHKGELAMVDQKV